MTGKDYMYCKMWLVSNGYDEHSAQCHLECRTTWRSTENERPAPGRFGIYQGIIFLGGFLGSLLYFRVASEFNFLAATVFGFLFLRYSKFASMRSPFGFAMNVHSDLYRERDSPEVWMFNYGVIAGFVYFFIALFPSPPIWVGRPPRYIPNSSTPSTSLNTSKGTSALPRFF